MTVRFANLTDIGRLMEFSRKACEQSPTYGPMGFNSVIWRRTLMGAFKDPTMCVIGNLSATDCKGILVGMKMPMPWSAGFCASDLVFAAEAGGDKMLALFVEWCERHRIRRIDMGVSDTGRDEAKDVLFSRAGFDKAGRVYYQTFEVK